MEQAVSATSSPSSLIEDMNAEVISILGDALGWAIEKTPELLVLEGLKNIHMESGAAIRREVGTPQNRGSRFLSMQAEWKNLYVLLSINPTQACLFTSAHRRTRYKEWIGKELRDLFAAQFYGSGEGNRGQDCNGFADIFSTSDSYLGQRSSLFKTQVVEVTEPWTYEALRFVLRAWCSPGSDPVHIGVMATERWQTLGEVGPLAQRASHIAAGRNDHPIARLGLEVIPIGGVSCIASPHCPQESFFVWKQDAIRLYCMPRSIAFLEWSGWQPEENGNSVGKVTICMNFIGEPWSCLRINSAGRAKAGGGASVHRADREK